MSRSDMDSGNPTDVDKLNPKWAYEPFTVVADGGIGEVALYNTYHKRFWRMAGNDMVRSDEMEKLGPPPQHSWLRFKPKLVMSKADADKAAIASGAEAKAEAEAAAAADAEALAIMQPGNIIALHNTELRRFVRMNGHNGRMDHRPRFPLITYPPTGNGRSSSSSTLVADKSRYTTPRPIGSAECRDLIWTRATRQTSIN